MENLPSLVLDNIFSHLNLSEKFDCFAVSKKWSFLLHEQFDRQVILDLCRYQNSSGDVYRCPNWRHQPTKSDHLSSCYAYSKGSSSGQLIAELCPNIAVLHADSVDELVSECLEAVISKLNNLVCVHLPYFGNDITVKRVILQLIKHHSKSLRHLLIKDEVSDETLWTVAKSLSNLEFLAIHHPIRHSKEFENWPYLLGPQFNGMHIDSNFDDLRTERILKPLTSRPTPDTVKELVLTASSCEVFKFICQRMTALETLIFYCDDLSFPENHKLTNLKSLRLHTNTEDRTSDYEHYFLRFLSQAVSLRILVLENFELTPMLAERIPKVCGKLEQLSLSDVFREFKICGDHILHLFSLPFLKSLHLEVAAIYLNSSTLLKFVGTWPKRLETVTLASCTDLVVENDFVSKLSSIAKATGREAIFSINADRILNRPDSDNWSCKETILNINSFSNKLEIFATILI